MCDKLSVSSFILASSFVFLPWLVNPLLFLTKVDTFSTLSYSFLVLPAQLVVFVLQKIPRPHLKSGRGILSAVKVVKTDAPIDA